MEATTDLSKKPTKEHRRFFFHYNKPASLSKKKPQISIHFKNKCIIVDNIEVRVQTEGKLNKRQPYFVMQGWAKEVEIVDEKAIVK